MTAGLFVLALVPWVAAEAPGSWTQTTQYPFDAYATSCAQSSSTIYCVGGYDSSLSTPADVDTVEYATLSGTGISAWTSTTPYPTTIYVPSCVTYAGYIYCVGGSDSQDVYYASVSSSGVGTWESSTSYPIPIEGESCVASGGYITCVGGTSYDDTGITASVYSAPISGSGVGTWVEQTDYACTSSCGSEGYTGIPTSTTVCVLTGSSTTYITCIGGEEKIYVGGSNPYDYPQVGYAFYATLSSGTVESTWTQTTTLPQPDVSGAGSCVSSNNYVYCQAGYDYDTGGVEVWYAQSSNGVLGSWTRAADLAQFVSTEQCVVYSGDIYCATGYMAAQDLTPYSYYTSTTLTAPSAPTLSAPTIDVNQAETVSGTIPSTGTAPYSWQWLFQVNGAGGYSATAFCSTNSGSGASAAAAETCSIPAGTLTAGDTYNFELQVTDATTATATSPPSATLTVNPALVVPAPAGVPSSIALGQSSSLSSAFSGGTPAFSCQWFEEAPGSATFVGLGSSACTSPASMLFTTTSATPTGTYSFELQVTDGVSSSVTSAAGTVTVAPRTTATTLACTPSSVPVNVEATCTATVTDTDAGTPVTPTGTVALSSSMPGTFSGACSLSGTGATSTCTFGYTPNAGSEGANTLKASYPGDTDHTGSKGTFKVTADKRTTTSTLVCTAPFKSGTATNCVVTVTDTSPGTAVTPTGSVTFSSSAAGSFSSTSCTLSGTGATASCSVKFTPSSTGSYTIKAKYPGDTNHTGSTAKTKFKVA